MRWQGTLQLVVGLGALFGLGYLSVPRFIEPLTEKRVVETAEAHAVVAASEVTTSWERNRSGRRALIRALAESPVFDESNDELLSDVLSSAAVQMGGGVAALVDRSSKIIASHGEASFLATLAATRDALGGAATVRLETIGNELNIVSAAPLANRRGALVVVSPLGDPQVRGWTRGLPTNVSVVVLDQARSLASTMPPRHRDAFAGVAATANGAVDVGGQRFRAARRTISDDAGAQITILGLAEIDASEVGLLIGHVQFLVMLLGGIALVLSVLVLLLAPVAAVQEEIDEVEAPISDTQPIDMSEIEAEEPMVQAVPEPALPKKLSPREAIERLEAKALAEAPPLTPPPPKIPAPSLESVTMPQPKKRPESDSSFALDVEQRFVPPAPVQTAPPSSVPARPTSAPPAGPSPFDQIAKAAFSAPPAKVAPQAPPAQRGGEDLLAPKGVDLSQIAAKANAQGRLPSHPPLPTDLPGLKTDPFSPPLSYPSGPPFASPGYASVPPPSTSSPGLGSFENLPGLRASDPRGGYDVNEVETQPARLMPARGPVDPWHNPVPLPPRPAPSISSQIQAPPPPSGLPMAYDEEHYRLVYNDFVSSKARLGEAIDNITYEGFRSKLRSSEEALINQHGCRAVRFQVLVRDNTVSLRPQLVR